MFQVSFCDRFLNHRNITISYSRKLKFTSIEVKGVPFGARNSDKMNSF